MLYFLKGCIESKINSAIASGSLSDIKGTTYGGLSYENVIQTPSIMFNFLGVEDVEKEGDRFEVKYRFGLYVYSAITSTPDDAILECQSILWKYTSDNKEKGILPWYLKERQRVWGKDQLGRLWRFEYAETPKILIDDTSTNIRGVVYAEFFLSTRIDSLKLLEG